MVLGHFLVHGNSCIGMASHVTIYSVETYSSYSPDNCFYPLRSDPNMSQWYEKPYGSYSPSESSDSESEQWHSPCIARHG